MKLKLFITFLLSFWVLSSVKSQTLIPFREGSIWGYVDSVKNVIIKPQYQYAQRFKGTYAVVRNNNLSAIIDKNNQIIIPFKYQFLEYLGQDKFAFGDRAKYFGEYLIGVRNANDQTIVQPVYNHITLINNTFAVTKNVETVIGKSEGNNVRSVNPRNGLLNINGQEIIACKYDFINWVSDSLIVLSIDNNQALFSSSGRQLTHFKYMVIGNFQDGLSKMRVGNLFGYIDIKGKEIISAKYKMCYPFTEDVAVVVTDDGTGAINKKGKLIVKDSYQKLRCASLGVMSAQKQNKWGLIDIRGREVIKTIYDTIKRQYNGVIALKKGKAWAIYNNKGENLTDFQYSDIIIYQLDEDIVMNFDLTRLPLSAKKQVFVKKDNKWGIVDMYGKEVVTPLYSLDQIYQKAN
jgi:hypothetical protein